MRRSIKIASRKFDARRINDLHEGLFPSELKKAWFGVNSFTCPDAYARLARQPIMRLRSSAFADGSTIPRRFTCDGQDISPPLEWSDVPAGAKSFALLCDDPGAPGGTWHHWAAYDIPGSQTSLPLDASSNAEKLGCKQAINDFGKLGYGGPCPPPGAPHHYHFRLLALSIEELSVRAGASCRGVEGEARKHSLAEATLVGIYRR
jgi:Raf kinase inhibitor-like YbhB/YbcL family protein